MPYSSQLVLKFKMYSLRQSWFSILVCVIIVTCYANQNAAKEKLWDSRVAGMTSPEIEEALQVRIDFLPELGNVKPG